MKSSDAHCIAVVYIHSRKKIYGTRISDRAKFYGFGTKSVTLRIYYVDLHD